MSWQKHCPRFSSITRFFSKISRSSWHIYPCICKIYIIFVIPSTISSYQLFISIKNIIIWCFRIQNFNQTIKSLCFYKKIFICIYSFQIRTIWEYICIIVIKNIFWNFFWSFCFIPPHITTTYINNLYSLQTIKHISNLC